MKMREPRHERFTDEPSGRRYDRCKAPKSQDNSNKGDDVRNEPDSSGRSRRQMGLALPTRKPSPPPPELATRARKIGGAWVKLREKSCRAQCTDKCGAGT